MKENAHSAQMDKTSSSFSPGDLTNEWILFRRITWLINTAINKYVKPCPTYTPTSSCQYAARTEASRNSMLNIFTVTRCCVVVAPADSRQQARTRDTLAQLDKSVWSTATSPASPPHAISGGFAPWLDPRLHKCPLSASQTVGTWTTAVPA